MAVRGGAELRVADRPATGRQEGDDREHQQQREAEGDGDRGRGGGLDDEPTWAAAPRATLATNSTGPETVVPAGRRRRAVGWRRRRPSSG